MISQIHLSAIIAITVVLWATTLFLSGFKITSDFFRPFSVIVCVLSILLLVFDRWLWRLRIFQGWFVSRPDLEGTWQVEIRPTWSDSDDRLDRVEAYMAIRQTLSTINMRQMTEESSSELLASEIVLSADKTYKLFGIYRNEPKLSVREQNPIHNGGLMLQVQGSPPDRLEGHYWTDRKSGGEMILREHHEKVFESFQSARDAWARGEEM